MVEKSRPKINLQTEPIHRLNILAQSITNILKKYTMKITISYCSINHYNKDNINQWMWMFRKYEYIKGFIVRILGVYINVRESHAKEKLINIANSMRATKNTNI